MRRVGPSIVATNPTTFPGIGRGPHQHEVVVERAARQHRGRRRTQRLREAARAGLLQVGVVDPDLLAVGHDDLLEGLGVGEAEAVRPRELEAAAAHLLLRAVGRGDGLRELRAAALHLAHEVAQRIDRIGARREGRAAKNQHQGETKVHASRLGTMMSRLPLLDMPLTSPDFSICSSSRAARL